MPVKAHAQSKKTTKQNVSKGVLDTGGDWDESGLGARLSGAKKPEVKTGVNACHDYTDDDCHPRQSKREEGADRSRSKQDDAAAATRADDDVSSFPHENSRNKNYDNHNFFFLVCPGNRKERGQGSLSVDLCFVSHWTKETLRRIGQGIFGPNWRLFFFLSGRLFIYIKSCI